MILYLVSQLVLMVMLDLYLLMRLRQFGTLHLDQLHMIRLDLASLRNDISLLKAKEGVNGAAFGLINALTDFEEIRKPKVDENRAKAAQTRRDWWAKKKEEQNAPPKVTPPSCPNTLHKTSGISQSSEVPEPLR